MKKNLFITGGSGQDGTILNKLFKHHKNYNLINIVDQKNKIKNKNTLILNLLDKKEINQLFKSKIPHVVLHLGSKNPSIFENSYNIYFKNNFECTKNLFNSTFENNNKAKFIFCNSSQIFKKKHGRVNEKSLMKENSDYTKFRIMAHKEMLKYKRLNKIKYSNIILFNHDSIFRNKKFIIPRIMIALKENNSSFIQEIINYNISADFSHAQDICNGIKKIILSSKNLDNIILSSNKITKINDLIQYILKKNKINNNFKFNIKINKKTLVGNNSLAKKKFNWVPKKNIFIAANEIYNFYNKK